MFNWLRQHFTKDLQKEVNALRREADCKKAPLENMRLFVFSTQFICEMNTHVSPQGLGVNVSTGTNDRYVLVADSFEMAKMICLQHLDEKEDQIRTENSVRSIKSSAEVICDIPLKNIWGFHAMVDDIVDWVTSDESDRIDNEQKINLPLK